MQISHLQMEIFKWNIFKWKHKISYRSLDPNFQETFPGNTELNDTKNQTEIESL